MKIFEICELEIISFGVEDVITTSGGENGFNSKTGFNGEGDFFGTPISGAGA